jgi:hypothetical protein
MVRFPAGARDFSLIYRVQTDSGHPPPLPGLLSNGFRNSFPEVARTQREAKLHLTPILRVSGAIPTLPHTFAWRGA